jgi:cell division septal protein FtsQ
MFCALEGGALWRRAPGATFSEHVWGWFRVRDDRPTALVVVARGMLAVFLVWLGGHLVFGWWTPSDPWPW